MIDEVEISGFQSHKNTTIQFDKGVNVVIGTNDSGKSAIFRALAWVFQNRPLGEAFKNWSLAKKDSVTVGIQFDDGWIIKERKDGKNLYETENTPKPIEALKTDLPEEVTSVTKISEINIQGQHERHFLLHDSPGEVARKFNEIVGLDIIDKVFKYLSSKINDCKRQDTNYNNEINELQQQIAERAFLDEIQPIVKKLDTDVEKQEIVEIQARKLRNFVSDLKKVEDEITRASIDPEFEKRVNSVLSLIKTFQKTKAEKQKIERFINDYKKVDDLSSKELEWLSIEIPVKSIQKDINFYGEAKKQRASLQKLVSSYKLMEKEMRISEENVVKLTTNYNVLLKKAGVCPVCGSVIK